MISNTQFSDDNVRLLVTTSGSFKDTTWIALVKQQMQNDTLKCRTCKIYSKNVDNTVSHEIKCACGRYARRHSYTGIPEEKFQNSQRWRSNFSAIVHLTVYGQRTNGARFIRCDVQQPGTIETLVQLITRDTDRIPKLLVSCYGGAKDFTMTDSLEREFMSGIGQLGTTEDVWMLTTGLNEGVSKFIGQGINRYQLLHENTSKPTVIGMTSWGTLTEYTRLLLKAEAKSDSVISFQPMRNFFEGSPQETLNVNHTHFLLLDDGRLNCYINDNPRSQFVQTACEQINCHPVTIIVEGGRNTLEVILNDLRNGRPVVIVAGSGRLSNVLGEIFENISHSTNIGEDEVKEQLRLCHALWPPNEEEPKEMIEMIQDIFQKKYRRYLSVFRLGQDTSLTNTIFRAVFDVQENLKEPQKLLELAVRWNCVDGANDMFQKIPNDERRKYYPLLFEQALRNNRPLFVDYFLRRYHNPLETTAFLKYRNTDILHMKNSSTNENNTEDETCIEYALQFIIEILYKNISKAPTPRSPIPRNLNGIDRNNLQLIGSYIQSFYRKIDAFQRFRQTLSSLCKSAGPVRLWSSPMIHNSEASNRIVVATEPSESLTMLVRYPIDKQFGEQEMLRDLFLWSVYAGYVDIAFVLLLQLKSRIGAALMAASIAERLSFDATNVSTRNVYNEHRIAYEEYATACVKACYAQNERLACQLLLREIPLLGNITCMQVAIGSGIVPFINTDCFNEVLDRQWYGHLDKVPKTYFWTAFKFTLSLISFGLLAPLIVDYRLPDDVDNLKKCESPIIHSESIRSEWEGIEDQSSENPTYWRRFRQFHHSPIIKMFYEFIIYIWFLMVFSYMMLFHMKSIDEPIHWTEIYMIVTVSAAFIEQVRKIIIEFHTQMLERWHRKSLWILLVYATPYILFYIGIGLHFGSRVRSTLFTPARIVLAIDLELWYIFSLQFVSAIKFLGPKLFMMKNMMRYLAAFMYIILVCMTAYGVVSRALTMYSSLDFTVKNLARALFYRPYWFLYSVVDDERNFLDGIIESTTNSSDQVAEAMVTHILLGFHMLFINILVLNLLIAAFNFAINDVQDMNEYFWRYQRYELVRGYFEKSKFAFPPFSLLVYILLLIRLIHRRRMIPRIFKRLATPELDKIWTNFENAATYEYACDFVDKKYKSNIQNHLSSSENQAENNTSLQKQVDALNEKVSQMQKNINEIHSQAKQMMIGIDRMMKMMVRDGMAPPHSISKELLQSVDINMDSASNE